MAVDLKQFHQVFIEESVEGLDAMESALMELDMESIDDEVINTIFRSAHSIKGGGGTFGFSALASFTHVLETLLDEVRSGHRGLTTEQINLLLRSVDCMREMLSLIQEERNEYTPAAIEVQAALEAVLGAKAEVDAPELTASEDSVNCWEIIFKPAASIIRTGNDPLRLIRDLCELADNSIVELLGATPSLEDFIAEDCCFHWKITLDGKAITELAIREVFEWVEDDCELILNSQAQMDGNIAFSENRWRIHFAPYPHLFQTGNDPVRIINELTHLGEIVSCTLNDSQLPSFKLMDSEKCYISWDIELLGPSNKSEIDDVFEWVTGEGDIHIEAVNSSVLPIIEPEDASVVPEQKMVSQPAQPKLADTPKTIEKKVVSGAVVDVPEKNTAKQVQKKASSESSSIRVGIDKVDSLINMVGELVITQSMLGQLGSDFDIASLPKLIEGLSQLEQNTRELQESVMRIRMLPISFTFKRMYFLIQEKAKAAVFLPLLLA
jgi:two-component system chemotaxis sensor kinase CheA